MYRPKNRVYWGLCVRNFDLVIAFWYTECVIQAGRLGVGSFSEARKTFEERRYLGGKNKLAEKVTGVLFWG